ncbi:MAG: hypothetical protein K6E37_03195 [Bacteroidales bacterium]|nr:hypothetical protein [Bacteroidales bacterium]
MKFGKFVLISAVAFCAVSCLEGLKNLGVDVNVDKTTQTSSTEFLNIEGESALAADNSGEMAVVSEAQNSISQSITLPSSGSTKVGSLSIKIEDMPEISNGAVIEDSQIKLVFDNPAEKPVKFTGSVQLNGENAGFSVVVPAKAIGYKVLIAKGGTTAASGCDEVVTPPSDLQKILNKKPSGNMLIEMEVSESAKSSKKLAASDTYTFKIVGALITPFHFKAGDKIHIKHTLKDLGLNLGDYDIDANSFDIYCDVTSTIPFEIACTGKDVNGVTAKTNNPIKAGTIANPVKTSVVISVDGAKSSPTIKQVTLDFELTATEGAKINKNQSLKIDYDKIKVSILK